MPSEHVVADSSARELGLLVVGVRVGKGVEHGEDIAAVGLVVREQVVGGAGEAEVGTAQPGSL
jgi:hypothetical protein